MPPLTYFIAKLHSRRLLDFSKNQNFSQMKIWHHWEFPPKKMCPWLRGNSKNVLNNYSTKLYWIKFLVSLTAIFKKQHSLRDIISICSFWKNQNSTTHDYLPSSAPFPHYVYPQAYFYTISHNDSLKEVRHFCMKGASTYGKESEAVIFWKNSSSPRILSTQLRKFPFFFPWTKNLNWQNGPTFPW